MFSRKQGGVGGDHFLLGFAKREAVFAHGKDSGVNTNKNIPHDPKRAHRWWDIHTDETADALSFS